MYIPYVNELTYTKNKKKNLKKIINDLEDKRYNITYPIIKDRKQITEKKKDDEVVNDQGKGEENQVINETTINEDNCVKNSEPTKISNNITDDIIKSSQKEAIAQVLIDYYKYEMKFKPKENSDTDKSNNVFHEEYHDVLNTILNVNTNLRNYVTCKMKLDLN